MITSRAITLVTAALLTACEQPWELLETATTVETLRTIHAAEDGTVFMGGTRIHRIKDQDVTERINIISATGGLVENARIEGVLAQTQDVYAWIPGALLRLVGNSFSTQPLPRGVDNQPIADVWSPSALVPFVNDTLVLASSVGGRARLFEGNARAGWAEVREIEGSATEVVWLTRGQSGSVFGGDGRSGASTLVERTSAGWRRIAAFRQTGVFRAAASGNRLFTLAMDGVRGFNLDTFEEENDVSMEGTFFDICTFPDGRAVMVGPPQGPLFPLWILEERGWANVNVGTRETLRSVHCGDDGKILAVGDHGMAVRQR